MTGESSGRSLFPEGVGQESDRGLIRVRQNIPALCFQAGLDRHSRKQVQSRTGLSRQGDNCLEKAGAGHRVCFGISRQLGNLTDDFRRLRLVECRKSEDGFLAYGHAINIGRPDLDFRN